MESITRRDGTLMDASSISEEDIVEICVKWGCIHPLGVFCYSAVESIVLFLTVDDLKCASHDIAGETKLHDEAIIVKAMAPTETHISAYAMVWHVKPSKGGGRPHTPPQQTHPGGETPHYLHVELGDLDNQELCQLMADLNQELAQCELIVPPSDPLQMTGYANQEVKSLRRMTKRSPFQEGEGGVHWGNPLWSNQLEEGFPLDHPRDHHVLHQQDEMWSNELLP